MRFNALFFTSVTLSFSSLITAEVQCGHTKLAYDEPRNQFIVEGLTDFVHYVPTMFPTPQKNLVLLADDLCRLFVTCMGFTGEQRQTQVPECEQSNRAVVTDAMYAGDSVEDVVKKLEVATNRRIVSKRGDFGNWPY